MSISSCRFAAHYRGRHHPDDALWWLDHPDRPGPTGAAPVQWLFLEAVDQLEATGLEETARAMLASLADLLRSDRRAALDALGHAEEGGRP